MSQAGGMDVELRCRTTNLTPSLTTLLATATACFGSQASSYSLASSILPSTPPLALMSAIACLAPMNCMSPYCVTGPVFGPAMPILMVSAANEWPATPARTIAANSLEICLVALVIVLHSYCCSFYSPGAVAAEPGQIYSIPSGKCPRQLYRYSVERRLLAWEGSAGDRKSV